jgi:hypothetical protein
MADGRKRSAPPRFGREDIVAAVREDVRQALELPPDLLHEAIRQGVADAVWRLATSGTATPHADFFDAIKDGAREGVERFYGGNSGNGDE